MECCFVSLSRGEKKPTARRKHFCWGYIPLYSSLKENLAINLHQWQLYASNRQYLLFRIFFLFFSTPLLSFPLLHNFPLYNFFPSCSQTHTLGKAHSFDYYNLRDKWLNNCFVNSKARCNAFASQNLVSEYKHLVMALRLHYWKTNPILIYGNRRGI